MSKVPAFPCVFLDTTPVSGGTGGRMYAKVNVCQPLPLPLPPIAEHSEADGHVTLIKEPTTTTAHELPSQCPMPLPPTAQHSEADGHVTSLKPPPPTMVHEFPSQCWMLVPTAQQFDADAH